MTRPSDTGTPEGRFPGFDTITEWVAWEHGWHVCSYCGATDPDVKPEFVHVGGHAGDVTQFRCTRPDSVCGWVYAQCGPA
jgi:hypothetical protein